MLTGREKEIFKFHILLLCREIEREKRERERERVLRDNIAMYITPWVNCSDNIYTTNTHAHLTDIN